ASLCSAKVAGNQHSLDMGPLADCAAGRSSSRIPMQLADDRALEEDKINRWTKDLGPWGQTLGPTMASTLSCGKAQTAPEDYLADSQDGHAILMDSREGPAFMEEKEFSLHPGEM
ncbi:unnamed protein product, partial [Cladocopium goreaui]